MKQFSELPIIRKKGSGKARVYTVKGRSCSVTFVPRVNEASTFVRHGGVLYEAPQEQLWEYAPENSFYIGISFLNSGAVGQLQSCVVSFHVVTACLKVLKRLPTSTV